MKQLIFYLLLITCVAQGQSSNYVDSLEQLLHRIKEPYEKAAILNQLAYAHIYPNPQKAINYAYKAIAVLPTEHKERVASLYNTIGAALGQLNEIEKSLTYFDSAIVVFETANDKVGIAMTLGNISGLYCIIGEYDKASSTIYKSILIHEELQDKEGIATNLSTLVSINLIQENLESGLKNAQKALLLFSELNQVNHQGMMCDNIGLIYARKKNVDSSSYYFQQALTFYEKINNKQGCAMVFSSLSELYIAHDDFGLALKYLNKAIALRDFIETPIEQINLDFNHATILYSQKEYTKSLEIYQKALEFTVKNNFKNQKVDALNGLIKNYVALNNFKEAFLYQEKLINAKDSILDESKQETIKDLEIKYETYKKEQENALLAKDRDLQKLSAERGRQFNYGIAIVLILVLMVSYLLLRQYKNRSIQQTLELKHRLLRNQMNPHFIFNSLIAIQSFVYTHDPKQAGKYLSSFAKLVRAILENSREEYISLSKEIQWLENYLKLQLLRFDNKFEYTIHIDKNIDVESTVIPPMLTQPFIENALEHGLKNIDYLGQLTIHFKHLSNELHISVQDNGVGLSVANEAKEKNNHVSLATKITKERLDYLNQHHKKKINFTIASVEPQGTLVSFVIPLKKIY